MALDNKSMNTLSAGALRRLAHSVRPQKGSEAWVVMQAENPPFYRVEVVAATKQAAEAAFLARGVPEAQYFMVGPIDEAAEDCPPEEEFDPSLHTCFSEPEEPTRFYVTTTEGGSERPLDKKPKRKDVFGVNLTVRVKGDFDIHYKWKNTSGEFPYDAICLTPCASKKFFYPYYRSLYGSGYVEQLAKLLGHDKTP